MREELRSKFLTTLNKDIPSISRDPDVMIFAFIYRVGTVFEFDPLVLSDVLSSGYPYISRQEPGALCGLNKIGY